MQTGISVYVGLDDYNIKDTIKYLHNAKESGVEYVFSSAHINEASEAFDDLELIINECSKLDLKLSLDISKPVYEKIKLPTDLYALRLDYGFTEEDIIKLSNEAPFLIELNASTVTTDKLIRLLRNGLNPSRTRLTYNFYPKLYTGHDIETVYENTLIFKELGFLVYAFVPSKKGLRPPMYEGLPTVEAHRNLDLALAVEELKICKIDGIYFGDAYASCEELMILNKHKCDETIIELHLNKEFSNLESKINKIYTIRPDCNNIMLRLSGTRALDNIEPCNCVSRFKNDVTMDNCQFKRYMGEICIVLSNLPADQRVNVIGKINTTDFILYNLKNIEKFKFEIIKKG